MARNGSRFERGLRPRWENDRLRDAGGGCRIVRCSNRAGGRTLPVEDHVGDVAFSPTGDLLAAGSDDNLIRLWKTADYSLLNTLEGHTDFVNGITFSPDGSLLVSGSHDKSLGIWAVKIGQLLKRLPGHQQVVLRVAVNPSGTLIASISWDGTVRLWGVE